MLFKQVSKVAQWGFVSVAVFSLMACSPQGTEVQGGGEKIASEMPQTVNFGIISTESSQNQKQSWTPLLADMSAAIGVEVKPFFASDYAGVIQGMRFDKVDLAWFGNKSAMEAVDRANGEVFAQVVYDDGTTGYHSLLIAHKDSPISSEKDMLAKANELTFANGDPNSTSGNLVPGYYVFGKNNVQANQIFKRTVNANHESNAMAVANKQVDVGTFSNSNWLLMQKKQPQIIDQLKVIWTSPTIESDPLVLRKGLSPELQAKIKTFILGYGDTSEQKAVMATLGWSKFKASDNSQLDSIRELEAFKQKQTQAAQ